MDDDGKDTTTWVEIAHVRNWSVTVTRDVLETTALGDGDRTYVQGLRGATGTATILYDNDVTTEGYKLWNEIFRRINCSEDKAPNKLKFKFDNCYGSRGGDTFEGGDETNNESDGQIFFNGYVTSFTHNVAVGEVQAANISFTSTGPVHDGNPYPN